MSFRQAEIDIRSWFDGKWKSFGVEDNLLTNPNDWELSGWSGNATATADSAVKTLEGQDTTLVNDDSAVSNESSSQLVSIGTNNSNVYSLAVKIKKKTSPVIMMGLQFTGGATPALGFIFANLETGQIIDRSGFPPADSGVLNLGGGWYQPWLNVNNNSSGHTGVFLLFYPAPRGDLNSSDLVAATTGSVNVYGGQLGVDGSLDDYTSIAWPDWDFDKPNATWIRFNVQNNVGTQISIGSPNSNTFRRLGTVTVQVFQKEGQGGDDARIKADRVAEIFLDNDLAGYEFYNVNARAIGNDENGWYQWNVTAEYRYNVTT